MVNESTSSQLTNIEKTLRKGEPTNFDISLEGCYPLGKPLT